MKIGMISLGCPKNLVDSEVMLGLAQQAGHELTQDPGAADVLVVNTCAFIDSAKKESIETILEMAQHKKDGSCQRLVVTGCLAERYRDELRAEIPEIDAVLGTGEVPEIVKAIGGVGTRQSSPLTFFRPRVTFPEATEQMPRPAPCKFTQHPASSQHLAPCTIHPTHPHAADLRRVQPRARPTSTTPTPLASSRRRGTTPT